jgi:hypothetical protein
MRRRECKEYSNLTGRLLQSSQPLVAYCSAYTVIIPPAGAEEPELQKLKRILPENSSRTPIDGWIMKRYEKRL